MAPRARLGELEAPVVLDIPHPVRLAALGVPHHGGLRSDSRVGGGVCGLLDAHPPSRPHAIPHDERWIKLLEVEPLSFETPRSKALM